MPIKMTPAVPHSPTTVQKEGELPKQKQAEYCCDGSDPNDQMITGVSGRFPWSNTVGDLKENIYNKKNLIVPSELRWKTGSRGHLKNNKGAYINDLEKFDADFFGQSHAEAQSIEPQQRVLLEVCSEAIADSGYVMEELREKRIGVYCAVYNYDSRDLITREVEYNTFNLIDYNNGLFANRCSQVFGFKGPSFVVDTACSSSAVAFGCAFEDVKSGRVDAAVVGGSALCLNAEIYDLYVACKISSEDFTIRPFDESVHGMLRSEAIVAMFIQKASAARRVYAKILNSCTNSSGYVADGLYVPSKPAQVEVYKDALKGSNIDPLEIDYVETHGTGTIVGDPIETGSLAEIYCKGRKNPLLIGTIKSVIGHTEASAGLCGILKAILALESGFISPNMNYSTPNPRCQPLLDGRIAVVTETTPLTSSYISVSSFGFGGTNCHVILKQNVLKKGRATAEKIPELILYGATTQEGVKHMLHHVTSTKNPPEFFTLLRNLAYSSLSSIPYRGYALICDAPVLDVKLSRFDDREIWYVVTGLGSQWHGMGHELMNIEAFSASVMRAAYVLKPLGVDLLEILGSTTNHLSCKPNITAILVSVCAIQIALIDVLKLLEINPDGIVGHSIGELACAYADQCCTAEEAILCAYWIGTAIESSKFSAGAMALVEMTSQEVEDFATIDVQVVSRVNSGFFFVSGSKEPLEAFVAKMKKEGRFSHVIDTCGHALHSTGMSGSTLAVENALQKVIKSPRRRSYRWVNTCSLEKRNKPETNIVDASYFANSLHSTVDIAEALKKIPAKAIVIEISPNNLLQSIIENNATKGTSCLCLMKRGDDINFMMENIGKLYCMGLNPKIEKLYSCPKYPVPRGTPAIAELIKWDHSVSWFVPKFNDSARTNIRIAAAISQEDSYLLDHCLDGKPLYPAAGYIYLVWEALATKMNKDHIDVPLLIQDFKIHRATLLSKKEDKIFNIFISDDDGQFHIVESGDLLASGTVTSPVELKIKLCEPIYQKLDERRTLSGQELYAELKIRGYEYGPDFQGIIEADVEGTQGLVKWTDRWIPYLDAHLLFFGVMHDRYLNLPTGVVSIKIDPTQVLAFVESQDNDNSKGTPVTFENYIQRCCSPGIEMKGLKVEATQQHASSKIQPILEKCQFIPYDQTCAIEDDIMQSIIEYSNVCNIIANESVVALMSMEKDIRKMLPKYISPKISQDVIEMHLNPETQNKEHVLLKLLAKIKNSELLLENKHDIFESYVKNVGNDILYRTMFNEFSLRIILEVIAENTSGKLNVTELSNRSQPLLPLVNKVLSKFYNCKPDCTLLHPEPEYVDADALKGQNIEVKAFNSMKNLQVSTSQDILISSFLFDSQESLGAHMKLLTSFAHTGSFLLLYCKTNVSYAEMILNILCGKTILTLSSVVIEKTLGELNLTIIAKKADSLGSTVYLLRFENNNACYAYDTIIHISDGDHNRWVGQLQIAMNSVNEDKNGRIWLVADDNPENGIVGLVKCLKQEPGGDRIRCVYVFKDETLQTVPPFDLSSSFYAEVVQRDILMNVYQNGMWGSFKHTAIVTDPQPRTVDHSFLCCTQLGNLSSFKWRESSVKYEIGAGEENDIAYIYYSGLNFKDVMVATGKLSLSALRNEFGEIPVNSIGLEFAGITPQGRRVMGMGLENGLATSIVFTKTAWFDVPDHWSLEEAATIPVVYCTVYYALIIRGHLQNGESILIHSGTGGIGIAAIRVALSYKCQIFLTVGTAEKRKYLKKIFPEIKDEHIGCSRDLSFEDAILNYTKGKGVDIVLNSLAEEKLQAGTRCLAERGRFLEIGKYDISKDTPLRLALFSKGASFSGIHVDRLIFDIKGQSVSSSMNLVKEGIRSGVVQPLERTVFGNGDVEKAFRYMATGKHVGKVVLKIRDEPLKGTLPRPYVLKVQPSLQFYHHKTYIIIGGLGGFGIELTKWLLCTGARNIIITSRYGARTSYHQLCLLRWKKQFKNVKVFTLDASKYSAAEKLLQEASAIGPVGGIFNSAVVLKDAFMENQTAEYFEEVCAPKATATKNLDKLSRAMCPQLDYFVCFSSISCGKGNAGQTNYGYANSVMERVCEKRRKEGFHGLAVQWGIIGDVGVVHRQIGEDAMIAGVMSQRISSCLATLEQFLLLNQSVLCSYVQVDTSRKRELKQDDVLAQLARIFGFPSVADMKMIRTFREMGMDSMIGVELQHMLEYSYGMVVSIKDLQEMTVNDLKTIVESNTEEATTEDVRKQHTKHSVVTFSMPKNLIPKALTLALNSVIKGTPMFFLHHAEAELLKFRDLACLLKYPVFGLLLTKDIPMHNIEAVAAAYLKNIQEWCAECHIVGLSSSAALAFEVCVQSQYCSSDSFIIKSFCILDGSLHLAHALTGAWKTTPPEELELSDFQSFLTQFSKSDLEQVNQELSNKKSYESRLSYVVTLLGPSCKEATGDIAEAIRTHARARDMCRNYSPSGVLGSDLNIIDTTGSLLANDVSLVKSSLSKVCHGKVSINRFRGGKDFLIEPETMHMISMLMNDSQSQTKQM